MAKRKNSVKKFRLAVSLAILAALAVAPGLDLFKPAYAVFPTNSTVLDNFNAPDNSSIGGRTTSSGAVWANSYINLATSTPLRITANQLDGTTGANGYLANTYGPDTEVYVDIPVTPPTFNNSYVALWSRIQNPGSNAFSAYALVYFHDASSSVWSLRRYDSSGITQIGAGSFNTPPLADGESLGLEVVGSGSTVTLTAYRKVGGVWSTVGSVADTSADRITSSGNIGIELGDNTDTLRADNFGGGDIINNTPPAAPSLTAPADNATDVSTAPQFQLRAADADADDLQYKIELCGDASCSNILNTIDQTASQTGWSGQDKQSDTAYGSDPSAAASTLASYQYQGPALANATQYWWRAYAIDPNGTNAFSVVSPIFSFTTQAAAGNNGNGNNNSGSGNGNNSSGNNSGNTSSGTGTSGANLDPDLTPSSYAKWGK